MTLPSFPNIDLFSAGINALNGVLVARHPSHNRGYAVVGLLIMAFFGGIGGGVARAVLLNDIPSPPKDPAYLLVCLLMGLLALAIYPSPSSRDGTVGETGLPFARAATEGEPTFLSRHADRGAGCVPVSSVRCSRTLAADRAARRARRRPTHVNYLTSEV